MILVYMYKIYYTYIYIYIYHILISIIVKQYTCLACRGVLICIGNATMLACGNHEIKKRLIPSLSAPNMVLYYTYWYIIYISGRLLQNIGHILTL